MPEIRVVVPEQTDKMLDSLLKLGFGSSKAELARLAIFQMLTTLPDRFSKDLHVESGFSPEGRIPQIEYAMETLNYGYLVAGAASSEGVVLAKRLPSPTEGLARLSHEIVNDPGEHYRTIQRVGSSIAVGRVGIDPDSRFVLMEAIARTKKAEVDGNVDVYKLSDTIAAIIHEHTVRKDCRVLGAGFIIGGLDTNDVPRLIQVDPSGSAFGVKVAAFGSNWSDVRHKMMDQIDSQDLSQEETTRMVIEAALQERVDPEYLLVDVLDRETKAFRELTLEEKKTFLA